MLFLLSLLVSLWHTEIFVGRWCSLWTLTTRWLFFFSFQVISSLTPTNFISSLTASLSPLRSLSACLKTALCRPLHYTLKLKLLQNIRNSPFCHSLHWFNLNNTVALKIKITERRRLAEEQGVLPVRWGRKWWHKEEVGQEVRGNKKGESLNPACYSTKEERRRWRKVMQQRGIDMFTKVTGRLRPCLLWMLFSPGRWKCCGDLANVGV